MSSPVALLVGDAARAASAALLAVTSAPPLACVDAAACAALGRSLPGGGAVAAAAASAPGVRFPLAFPSLESEVNFLSLLALLRFGAAWDASLGGGEGASDRALRGLLALHLGGSRLDADALQGLSEFGLGQAWGLRPQGDVPHATLPVVVRGEW